MRTHEQGSTQGATIGSRIGELLNPALNAISHIELSRRKIGSVLCSSVALGGAGAGFYQLVSIIGSAEPAMAAASAPNFSNSYSSQEKAAIKKCQPTEYTYRNAEVQVTDTWRVYQGDPFDPLIGDPRTYKSEMINKQNQIKKGLHLSKGAFKAMLAAEVCEGIIPKGSTWEAGLSGGWFPGSEFKPRDGVKVDYPTDVTGMIIEFEYNGYHYVVGDPKKCGNLLVKKFVIPATEKPAPKTPEVKVITVKVPGPTKYVKVPGPTKYVKVPGPTKTVIKTIPAEPTRPTKPAEPKKPLVYVRNICEDTAATNLGSNGDCPSDTFKIKRAGVKKSFEYNPGPNEVFNGITVGTCVVGQNVKVSETMPKDWKFWGSEHAVKGTSTKSQICKPGGNRFTFKKYQVKPTASTTPKPAPTRAASKASATCIPGTPDQPQPIVMTGDRTRTVFETISFNGTNTPQAHVTQKTLDGKLVAEATFAINPIDAKKLIIPLTFSETGKFIIETDLLDGSLTPAQFLAKCLVLAEIGDVPRTATTSPNTTTTASTTTTTTLPPATTTTPPATTITLPIVSKTPPTTTVIATPGGGTTTTIVPGGPGSPPIKP